ncbi:MAG: hypothetical protein LBU60_01105 [Clostridiales bacterium]|nr:hypothetical protein [Clostridiales bacterium]
MDNIIKLKKLYDYHLTWKDFDTLCCNLTKQIQESDFCPEYIYGIPRGGLPLSVVLSNKLGVNMTFDCLDKVKDNKKVLIVDDITDTGETLKRIKNFYQMQGKLNWIRFATLLYRQDSALIPDYYGEILTNSIGNVDYKWIVFPWE